MDREFIRKYQLSQYELLKYFSEFCNKNDLKYFLVWGSLLGAIREKGFIPWDADIDVAMFREDYDKFCELFDNNRHSKVFLDTYKTDRNHTAPHAILRILKTNIHYKNFKTEEKFKCNGIYIDIFPLDKVVDDEKLRKKQLKKIAFLQKIITLKKAICWDNSSSIKKFVKKTISYALKPFTYSMINKIMDNEYQRYNSTDTKYIAMLTDPLWYPKQTFEKNVFQSDRKCLFEGEYFSVPKKAEEFLLVAYGDYMSLPPENKRYFYLDNIIDYIDYGPYKDGVKL